MRCARARALLLLVLLLPSAASAQFVWRPDARWHTVSTVHFVVHYPAEFEAWSLTMASQLESIRAAVGREVGSLPRKRVSVLVADPVAMSNGSAYPFMESPAIILWPTPPDPRSGIGKSRSWPELLSVHEFAHVAHLVRPSRNRRERLLARLAPLGIGPVLRKSPAWVIEGYATYVEGRLTGSGRPNGVWRPAVLRQWALEGRLPTYGGLSGNDEFQGGAFRYLGGSAFLEWLALRRGDSTVTHLWRRLSARTTRSFDAAFAGVYGDAPRDLYGRFTAELTGRALEVERTLRDSGLVEGELVQRLAWTTGDPAVSPDGGRMAVVLRARNRPSRVVVWRTTADPPDTAAAARRARALKRDPEDVPDVATYPPARKPVATLKARDGIGFDSPRFVGDSSRILVSRFGYLSDGSRVPDLYLWDTRSGSVRRLTRGANLRYADPAPDGRTAVAVRCIAGSCGLARVSLETGAVVELVAGSPTRAYYRPRHSPDGRTIVAGVTEAGRWRLVAMGADGRERILGPDDDVDRYDADFAPDGYTVLHVSEAGGIPNVAALDARDGAITTLTRVIGAAFAPTVGGGRDIVFLSLHAKGLDVRRLRLDSALAAPPTVVRLDPALSPAAPRTGPPADTFARGGVGAPRAYGLGPREYRIVHSSGIAADGREALLGLTSTDKVGRLTWIAQGAYGSSWRPRGASLAAAWRGSRPSVTIEASTLSREASRQKPAGFTSVVDDIRLDGAALGSAYTREGGARAHELVIGASLQRLAFDAGAAGRRAVATGRLTIVERQIGEQISLSEQLVLDHAVGQSPGAQDGAGRGFNRGVVSGALSLASPAGRLRLEGTYGRSGGAAPFERFVVGGAQPAFTDDPTLSQWIAMPALPFGTLRGRTFGTYRVSAGDEALSPFFWSGSAGEGLRTWVRVVGVDAHVVVPPLPVVRLPRTELRGGAGYTLDEPWRKHLRGYFAIRYRP